MLSLLRLPFTVLALAAPCAFAAQGEDLANLSLEELANIQITSVSKKPEPLAAAAAAVFVIRAEDIRRAGIATLPEALRLAPNLQVARVDARNYAVTARGFNSVFENKLLVLIDGRTVYSPLFSGVFWDAQDMLLEDIERIEVISGPGATLWGANAVNGVINIISKTASSTQDAFASVGGDRQGRDLNARYGWTTEQGWQARLYAKLFEADDGSTQGGARSWFGMRRRQMGLRADGAAAGGNITVQGDAYDADMAQAGTMPIRLAGANLLSHWERVLGPDEALRVQAYLDHTERNQPNAYYDILDTLELEVQHSKKIGSNAVVWGASVRQARDRIINRNFSFLPDAVRLTWTSLFVQDSWQIAPSLSLRAGLRLARNPYTGMEHMPSASLSWQAAPQHFLWASWARAVRAPSRIDRDFFSPSNPPVVAGVKQYTIAGGPDFQSEVGRTTQLGYRGQPWSNLNIAATLYNTDLQALRTLETNPAGPGFTFQNKAEGTARGAELQVTWSVLASWHLTGAYALLKNNVVTIPGSKDVSGALGLANNDPANWSSLRSSVDLSEHLEFNAILRHVSALPKPSVPAYTALDLRLGWRVQRGLELGVSLQNLGAAEHPEFGSAPGRNVYPRLLALRMAWRQ